LRSRIYHLGPAPRSPGGPLRPSLHTVRIALGPDHDLRFSLDQLQSEFKAKFQQTQPKCLVNPGLDAIERRGIFSDTVHIAIFCPLECQKTLY